MAPIPQGGTVAVTGSAGFIGSWVVRLLLDEGYRVRACVRDASDSSKTGFLKAMPGYASGRLTLHSANLDDAGCFDEIFKGYYAMEEERQSRVKFVIFEEFGSGAAALHLKAELERDELLRDEDYRRRFRKDYESRFGTRVWHRDFFKHALTASGQPCEGEGTHKLRHSAAAQERECVSGQVGRWRGRERERER